MPAWPESDDPLPLATTAHARLAAWRQAHPHATLREIELEVDRQLAGLRAGMIERLAQTAADAPRPSCPTCGTTMQQVGERERTVRTAHDQRLTVRAPVIVARPVRSGFFPLAEALDLGPEQCSPWLLERAVRLGAELPFATAAEVLALLTGTRLSPSTIRRATIASGMAMRQRELAFIGEVEAGTAAAPPVPTARLQLSLDGSMIPLVHGEWREVRLLAIGELPPDAACPSASAFAAPSYAAGFCPADEFAREALGEVVRRGLDQAPHVAAISDGASWIQGFVDLQCPQAVRILDFAHAAGSLAEAAAEAFGAATEPAQDWFVAQRHELRHGDPDQVLAALAAVPTGVARETALRYLGERRAMIAYQALGAAGWPIGSGCVESAHKHVVQARLKRSGMHWTPAVVPSMLALRVTLANRRWDDAWPRVTTQRRTTRRAQRAAQRRLRRTASRTSPAPAGAPRLGKPAPDHPWRRPFLRPFPAPAAKT